MHVQVVTYSLRDVSEQEYITDATRVAPEIAAVPGLMAKIWLEDTENNRYGGIYFWEDREAMERGRIWTHPNAIDVVVDDYNVLPRLTKATEPVLSIV